MSRMSNDTDEDLLEAWQRGESAAGGILFERYQRPLSGFLIRFVGREDVVEEILGNLFESLIRRGGGYNRRSSCKTYLFAAAYKQMLTHFRSDRRYHARLRKLESFSTFDFNPDPSAYREFNRRRRLVAKALRRIRFEYQLVLELIVWEELNAREASEVLGEKYPTVRRWAQKAERALKAKVEELGGSPEMLATETVTLERFHKELCEAARHYNQDESEDSAKESK